ncbi:MAG: hypothetical protein ACPG6R_11245 [Aequoribacter sp.]|uniref:hypothetical protein n=1 Tax=Aequoribacter sp. TaxID=2847771 RepID=UPI003C3F6A52
MKHCTVAKPLNLSVTSPADGYISTCLAVLFTIILTYQVNQFAAEVYPARFQPMATGITFWMMAVVLLLGAQLFRSENTIGSWLAKYYFIFHLVPVLLISANIGSGLMLVSCSLGVISFAAFFHLTRPIRLSTRRFHVPSENIIFGFLILAVLVGLLMHPPNLSYGGSFTDLIFELRLAQRESNQSFGYGFLYPFMTKVAVPLMMSIAVWRSSGTLFLIATLLVILIFFTGGHRSVIGVSVASIGIAIIAKNASWRLPLVINTGLLALVILMTLETDILVYLKMILRRVLLIPAYFPELYWDVFRVDGNFFPGMVERYGLPTPFFIGMQIHGEVGARANAGSVASFIPALGFTGPIVGCLCIGVLLKQLDKAALGIRNDFVRRALFPLVPSILWILIDSNLETALLSQALIWLVLVLLLLKDFRCREYP